MYVHCTLVQNIDDELNVNPNPTMKHGKGAPTGQD